jgi:hypothetical protein
MLDVMMVLAFVAAGPQAIPVASDTSISAHAHGKAHARKMRSGAGQRRDDRNAAEPAKAEDFHGSSMPAR